MDYIDIIEKYRKEIEDDAKVDRLNVTDKQMMLPAIKHKWVARLINHKIEIKKYKNVRIKAIEQIVNDPQLTVTLSKIALQKQAEHSDAIKAIDIKIDEQELIVLYLEKVELIFKSMSYDISNMVELIKLETT